MNKGVSVALRFLNILRRFSLSERGAVLTETLLVIPVITIFTVGILEFGNVLWQRQQMQVGIRDAARYWSRCRPNFSNCSLTIARNIAFYGNPAGTGPLRVPNWSAAPDLEITPANPPAVPTPTDLVVVTGSADYFGSPLIAMLAIDPITMTYQHTERYIGW